MSNTPVFSTIVFFDFPLEGVFDTWKKCQELHINRWSIVRNSRIHSHSPWYSRKIHNRIRVSWESIRLHKSKISILLSDTLQFTELVTFMDSTRSLNLETVKFIVWEVTFDIFLVTWFLCFRTQTYNKDGVLLRH